MRQSLRAGLLALAVAALAPARPADAQGTAPPAGRPAAPATKGAMPPRPANFVQVLATVNGQPITRGELINFLSRFPLSPGKEKEMYEQGIEFIANNKLLSQFLTKRRVAVTEAELAKEVGGIEAKMKAEDGRDLKTALAESNLTIDDFRAQITPNLQWRKYVAEVATDAELQKYVEANKDAFSRVQVKASHILLLVPPDATPEAKAAARTKLEGIKRDIEAGKISFADAANKYSEDDANKTSPNGGDLGYFQRKGQFIEKFAAVAFAMKPRTISDPVETEFGMHLIQVTDRKPGLPFDFQQNKAAVMNQYMADRMEKIIEDEKKTAKIEIKPMPADLFPPAPTRPPAGAPGAGAAPGSAPATKGAAPKPAAPR